LRPNPVRRGTRGGRPRPGRRAAVPCLGERKYRETRAFGGGTRLALAFAAVAHPRRIVPHETYLITRRCYQRTFRLRPCAKTNAIFLYCLALAMEKTGVLVHAACVMSSRDAEAREVDAPASAPRRDVAATRSGQRGVHGVREALPGRSVQRPRGTWKGRWAASIGDWTASIGDWTASVGDWTASIGDWAGSIGDWAGSVGGWTASIGDWAGSVGGWTASIGDWYPLHRPRPRRWQLRDRSFLAWTFGEGVRISV
jgi:hypothetical protein